MSTRIILVNYRQKTGQTHLLGLLVEHATETLRRPEEDFESSGVAVAESPYLGPVLTDASGIIQRIEIEELLSESVCRLLYSEPVESQ